MMMILEVQEGADIELMPDELKAIIASVKGEFAEGIMVGTQPISGMQLLFVNVDASKDEVHFLTNHDGFDDEGGQIAFDLGWTVLAVEDEIVDQSFLLPFFTDTPVYEFDESGDYVQIGTEPVTDLTDKIQVWSGKKWLYS
jgi:hypothetical protein